MDQLQLRVVAIRRHFRGETVTSICRITGKSRRWFYYWLHRYSPTKKRWAHNLSRAPHHQPRKLARSTERLVCEVRKRLVDHKYSQRGAVAIQWELRQLGVDPLPAIWTINRIIQRHKLRARAARPLHHPAFPKLAAPTPGIVQQLDLVGPRYLSGGIRFYGQHLIDISSNAVALEIIDSKQSEAICQALADQWQRLGVPRYLQVDNELSFRGSNRYPRSVGLLGRLYLHAGVELVFIPEGEPWRNGVVERFNETYDKNFLRRQRFPSIDALRQELHQFEQFHNEHHRYAKLGQRTPQTVHMHRRCSKGFGIHTLDTIRQSWKNGRISFIRLTDHRGTVRFFTERFVVDPKLVHEYVTGTIHTRTSRLRFYHQGRCVKTMQYHISKNPNL